MPGGEEGSHQVGWRLKEGFRSQAKQSLKEPLSPQERKEEAARTVGLGPGNEGISIWGCLSGVFTLLWLRGGPHCHQSPFVHAATCSCTSLALLPVITTLTVFFTQIDHHLSIPLLMNIWIISSLGLFQILLLCTFIYISFTSYEHLWGLYI